MGHCFAVATCVLPVDCSKTCHVAIFRMWGRFASSARLWGSRLRTALPPAAVVGGAAAVLVPGTAAYALSLPSNAQSQTPPPWLPAEGPRGGAFADLPSMIESVFPSLVIVESSFGMGLSRGSGFVISEGGLICTNVHVLFGPPGVMRGAPSAVRVLFDDGRAYAVKPLAADVESDIAVGQIVAPEGTRFSHLRFKRSDDGKPLRRGEPLVVLGAPFGGSLVPTVGALSGARFVGDDELMAAVLHSRADWHLLQVDAAMSSGNSGGPVVNADGEVVGIAVMVRTGGPSGAEVGFVNYGVHADQAGRIVDSLLSHGSVLRPAVGLHLLPVNRLQDAEEQRATETRLLPARSLAPDGAPWHSGTIVLQADPGMPAHNAGLRAGDVILTINGKRVSCLGDYFRAVGPVYEPGRKLTCTVFRPAQGGATGSGDGGEIFTAEIFPVSRGSSMKRRVSTPPPRWRIWPHS